MKIAKIITLFLAALIIMGALAGCTSHKVLHDTDTLRVERDGRSLVVYDLAGDATYTLATKRVRKTEELASQAWDKVRKLPAGAAKDELEAERPRAYHLPDAEAIPIYEAILAK